MITKLKAHPAAELFPMMSDAELNDLAADIKAHGQLRPIQTIDGHRDEQLILDGRNRYEACLRAGVTPWTKRWAPGGEDISPIAWVLSENLRRRHLTVDQRALVAMEAQALFAGEAKARQRAAGGDRKSSKAKTHSLEHWFDANPAEPARIHPECGHSAGAHIHYEGGPLDRKRVLRCPDRLPPRGGKRSEAPRSPTAAQQAAQTTGVSARSVERALRVQAAKPEVLERVRSGEITLKQAEKQVVKAERLREVLAYQPPKGRFSVIVADPPWRYDDQLDGSDLARGGVDYPDMSVEEICALKVGENLATPDCALWLWCTNAFVIDGTAARVVREWGFEAKGMLTWCKDRWGGGHYLRGQTEHVILAVRGRPMVQGENTASFFTAKRGAHSEKPDEAYAIFERVTPAPDGARLDLFACKTRKGWFASGAEVTPGAVNASKRGRRVG